MSWVGIIPLFAAAIPKAKAKAQGTPKTAMSPALGQAAQGSAASQSGVFKRQGTGALGKSGAGVAATATNKLLGS